MNTDDLENELRNLKYVHLTESEMTAYRDEELDQMRRARVEAHLKQCFICARYLEQLREEGEALRTRNITAEERAFVDRVLEPMSVSHHLLAARSAKAAKKIPLRDRLTAYLQQLVASWQIQFAQEAMRGVSDQDKKVWGWQSKDGKLQAHATLEKNADLTIHFSATEMELEGTRLNVCLGPLKQEITLRRISESEVYAKVVVPRRQRPRKLANIAIEIV